MATFLQLQTRVYERVIDLPTTVTNRVPVLINQAIREMQRGYNFRAMETSAVFVTVENSLVPTPSTIALFKEYRDKGPYLLEFLSQARRYVTTTQANADLAILSDIDNPTQPVFLMNAVDPTSGVTTFSISPYPDTNSDWADGNYRIVVPSYSYSADLVASGDQNWFTNFADDYIELQAASEAFGLNWDFDKLALFAQQANNKLKSVIKADKMNRVSSVDTLVPMWRGANQPMVRR